MKDLIKVFMALAVMAGAFWIGRYLAEEKYSAQVNELKNQSEIDKGLILQLQDSLNLMKIEFGKIMFNNEEDTIKTKKTSR